MSSRGAARITPAELAEFKAVQDAEQKATNAHKRAEIRLASAQQDRAEWFQGIKRKYKLNDTDGLNAANGDILRNAAPPAK